MRLLRCCAAYFVIMNLILSPLLYAEEVQFTWIRVFKPYNNVPPGWDPRVAVYGAYPNPEVDNYENYLHWPKNNGDIAVINYYWNYPPPSEIYDISGFENAIHNAFAAWEALPNSNIDFNHAGTTFLSPPSEPTWSGEDGKNIVSFIDDSSLIDGFDEGVIGKTLLTWDSGDVDGDGVTTELIDCDILLNSGMLNNGQEYHWSLTTMNYSARLIDVQSVVTHEIGHLLGIAHPFGTSGRPDDEDVPTQTCPTMFASISPAFTTNLNMRTLEDYDKNCAAFLYPVLIEIDGNDSYQTATPVGAATYTDFSISESNDIDWYVTYLERYDTLKVSIIIPDEFLIYPNNQDLDLFICKNPENFSLTSPVNNITVYPMAELSFKSQSFNNTSLNYEVVFAHTVTQEGNYYIVVKGKDSSDLAPYTMNVYVSHDGDGDENSTNRKAPIPYGDLIPDAWEVEHGLNPTDIDDGLADADHDGLSAMDEYTLNSDPNNLDTDMDGMPDGWEYNNNLNILVEDASLDSDNDGKLNIDEYFAGTDPQDASSRFELQTISIQEEQTGLGAPTNAIMLHWFTSPERTYEVLYSDNESAPFTIIEEITLDGAIINGPNFLDQGFPPQHDPNAGSIRPAPGNSETGIRLYKIRVKQ